VTIADLIERLREFPGDFDVIVAVIRENGPWLLDAEIIGVEQSENRIIVIQAQEEA
jgi:hypothetical protein